MTNEKHPWIYDILFVLVLLLAGYLRLGGIEWGEGYHQHPDELFLTGVLDNLRAKTCDTPDLSVDACLPENRRWMTPLEYLDSAKSTLNPFNRGFGFFVYGNLPLTVTRVLMEATGNVLEDLPGVDFQRATRSSQYNNFVFQGHVSNNKILILLDGVRIDHPTGGKIPVAENFSLHFAKHVEVLFGPAAALYGADAFAGVINIITDKPGDHAEGKIAATAGSFGSLEGNFLVSSPLAAGFALTASAHYQESDRAPLDKTYPNSYPKVAAGGKSASQREDYVGDMSSQSQYLRLDYRDDVTLAFYRKRFRSLTSTGDNPSSAFYLSDAFWDTSVETWYGKYRFQPTASLKAELILDHSSYEIDPRTRYINKVTNFENHGYDYAYARRRGIEQNLNWQLNDKHALLAGLGYKDFYAVETPDLPWAYDTNKGPRGQGRPCRRHHDPEPSRVHFPETFQIANCSARSVDRERLGPSCRPEDRPRY